MDSEIEMLSSKSTLSQAYIESPISKYLMCRHRGENLPSCCLFEYISI